MSMDLSRLASCQSLLIVSCGDVERNPGPPKKGPCKSEVLRQFMRNSQSDFVNLLYEAKKQNPPSPLYMKDPPGWNTFDKETAFKNICNVKKDGNKIFDKLVKLCKREIVPIPKDILDVILCYEKLRDSKKDSDETKSLKDALESYVSKNKLKKNKNAILEHLDEKVFEEVIKKGTKGVEQGNIDLTFEGATNILEAFDCFMVAAKERLQPKFETHNTAVEKCPLAAEHQNATSMNLLTSLKTQTALCAACDRIKELEKSLAEKQLALDRVISENQQLQHKIKESKIEQVQRKRKSLDCIPVYACVETTEQGKPKRKKTAIRGKHNKAMVTQGSNHLTSQQLDTPMEMAPDYSGNHFNMDTNLQPLYSKPSYRLPHTEPPQQMAPQRIESQFKPLPSPPSPYCDGIIESDYADLQGGSTRNVPVVQNTSDMNHSLPTQDDSTDSLSESSLQDEDLKNMPLQDTIGKYLQCTH